MTHISPVSHVSNLEDSVGMTQDSPATGLLLPGGSSFIQGLRDNLGKKFSVELLSGALCRTELPPMTDSPGSKCLYPGVSDLGPKLVRLVKTGTF